MYKILTQTEPVNSSGENPVEIALLSTGEPGKHDYKYIFLFFFHCPITYWG